MVAILILTLLGACDLAHQPSLSTLPSARLRSPRTRRVRPAPPGVSGSARRASSKTKYMRKHGTRFRRSCMPGCKRQPLHKRQVARSRPARAGHCPDLDFLSSLALSLPRLKPLNPTTRHVSPWPAQPDQSPRSRSGAPLRSQSRGCRTAVGPGAPQIYTHAAAERPIDHSGSVDRRRPCAHRACCPAQRMRRHPLSLAARLRLRRHASPVRAPLGDKRSAAYT